MLAYTIDRREGSTLGCVALRAFTSRRGGVVESDERAPQGICRRVRYDWTC